MGNQITVDKYKQWYISPSLPCFKISYPSRETILYTDGFNFAYSVEELKDSEYNVLNTNYLLSIYPPSGGSWKCSSTRGFNGCLNDLHQRIIKLETWKQPIDLPIPLILLIEQYVDQPIECETVNVGYVGGN